MNIPSFSVAETKQIQNDSKHNFFSPKSRSKHWNLVNIRSVDFSVLFHSTGLTLIRYFSTLQIKDMLFIWHMVAAVMFQLLNRLENLNMCAWSDDMAYALACTNLM